MLKKFFFWCQFKTPKYWEQIIGAKYCPSRQVERNEQRNGGRGVWQDIMQIVNSRGSWADKRKQETLDW